MLFPSAHRKDLQENNKAARFELLRRKVAMSCRARPAWLQSALSDIEQRVKAISLPPAGEADSFAARAENYYEKRPQLISLLHELYSRYIHLVDRYTQTLDHTRRQSASDFDSDAESSLSFDPPPLPTPPIDAFLGALVVELVAAEIDREVLLVELGGSNQARAESARRAELQGSLLEVLEAERSVLLDENARLGYELAGAKEDARRLALEAAYMRQKAAELARCMVRMQADHRVCLLGRKIEELQKQVRGLEERNVEVRRGGKGWEASAAKWWGRVRKLGWVVSPCGPEISKEEL